MSADPSPNSAASNDGSPDSKLDDPRVTSLATEFLAALEAGQHPSRAQYTARHPELAREIDECLEGIELVHGATANLRRGLRDRETLTGNTARPLGDYQLLREIGRGGMGIVYEAVQLSLGRRVAVKVLPFAAAMDPKHLQRFKNEAQAAALLHHTNVVPVYAVGSERGVHFYAMQLIDGQPLSALIKHLRRLSGKDTPREEPSAPSTNATASFAAAGRAKPAQAGEPATDPWLTAAAPDQGAMISTKLFAQDITHRDYFRSAAEMIRQAATALEHAHQFGVIHRDIKPGNLLIDGRGHVWVTDFGLAQIQADVTLTRTGDLLGTLRYMSPEQAAGDRVVLDHRTDIYSLGVTFYELLTLEPVFGGSDRHDLLRRIVEEDPPRPRSIERTLPVELETIVLKATAKLPAERYATAQALADDLQRYLEDRPILARRPGVADLTRKWARRHRTIVVSAIILLVCISLGLVASMIVVGREHMQTVAALRREAEQRVAAEESFRQARQAVDTFLQLGEEELAYKPPFQRLRRRFLETALEYYHDFLNQRADDTSVADELAATSARVAGILDELSVLEGYAPLTLLGDPFVKEDLKLTATQQQTIDAILADMSFYWPEGSSLSPVERQKQLVERLRANQSRVAELLSPEQLKRLRQIIWQRQGLEAFDDPQVIAALQLTPEQRKQIDQIDDARRQESMRMMRPPHDRDDPEKPGRLPPHGPDDPGDRGEPPPEGFGGSRRFGDRDRGMRFGDHDHHGDRDPAAHAEEAAKWRERWKAAREASMQQALGVLSEHQRTLWTELVGTPFEHEIRWRPGSSLPF